MEELKKFQSSTFDTTARRRLVEDQDTILELTGKIQDLQNEINCMNDSKDFQDAESIRSGNSHVTSRPVSFPPHQIPEGMLSHSCGKPSRREGPPSIRDTHGMSGNVLKSRCVIFSTLSAGIEPMEFQYRRAASFIHSGIEWEANTRSRSEMPVWTVSQKLCHLQWRRLFKELWSRPTTTADFRSSFRQIPTPPTFACWKIRFKTEVCTCSQFPTEAMQWIKEVEMVDSVDDLKSSSSTRGTQMPNFEVLDARIASALNRIIHNSHFKRRVSLEEQKAQKQDRFLRGRQIAYLICEYFRFTGANDSVENYADLFTIGLRNDDIQEFDSKWDGILLSMTKIPPDDIKEGLYKLRYESLRNSRPYWNCMTWRFIRRK